MKKQRAVSDERWVVAIEAAERGNLRELVRTLLIIAPTPDWVRVELAPLFKNERALSDEDKNLLEAVAAYRMPARKHGEKRFDRMARIAAEHGIEPHTLQNFLDGRGRAYVRLRFRRKSSH